MDSPEQWRWIWLAATAVFAIGEMATPGSFFLAPFAAGALVASLLAFAGVSVLVEWIVFIVVSVIMLALLRPLSKRLDRDALDHGVGSRRLIGRQATVLRTIPAGDEIGMVRVDREQWRAQSIDGNPIAAGVPVRIADVQGTRVIVAPLDASGATALDATDNPDPATVAPPPPPSPPPHPAEPANPAPAGSAPAESAPDASANPTPEKPANPAPDGSAPAGSANPAPTAPAETANPAPDRSADPKRTESDSARPAELAEDAAPSAEPVEPPASGDGRSSP